MHEMKAPREAIAGTRMGQVSGEIEGLAEAANKLNDVALELSSRLDPVLTNAQPMPEDSPGVAECHTPLVPVAEALRMQREKVNHALSTITDIMERLEL